MGTAGERLTVATFNIWFDPLAAQEVTAGIYGNVQDSSSAVIANAEVTLRNVETGREYKKLSDSAGNYVLTLIPLAVCVARPTPRPANRS